MSQQFHIINQGFVDFELQYLNVHIRENYLTKKVKSI